MAEFPYDLIEQENHGLERPEPVELSPFVEGPQTGLMIPRPAPRRRSEAIWNVIYRIANVLAVLSVLVMVVGAVAIGMGWWR